MPCSLAHASVLLLQCPKQWFSKFARLIGNNTVPVLGTLNGLQYTQYYSVGKQSHAMVATK